MSMPAFKVNIAGTDYENTLCTNINVKCRENNYDTATLIMENTGGTTYGGKIDVLNEVKVYLDKGEGYVQVFGGHARQLNPIRAPTGDLLDVKCKGYGAALEATHCNREYGTESVNPTIDTCKEIWQDLVDNCINKSLGSASNTGYAITKTKICDYAAATPITFINNPFRNCKDVVDLVCDIATAIGAGSAGPHWIVDNSKNLIINTIGAHENTTEWPDWVNSTETLSDLTDAEFQSFNTVDNSDEFANKVVLVTDFRRPNYDLWTQATTGWGSNGLAAFTTDTGLIGNSLKFTQNGNNTGYIYYPSTQTAAWDITKWGSTKTIPKIVFYFKKDAAWDNGETASTGNLIFYTSAGNYYYPTSGAGVVFNINEAVGEWIAKSFDIGPNAASPEWTKVGAGDWTNINWVQFQVGSVLGAGNKTGWIDDLHFTGQIARCAYNSTSITTNNEYQKVFISRYALDDTCVAATTTGMAARLAYAQLLRRQALPYSITFTVPLEPSWMAGQKFKVNAITFRATSIEHSLSDAGGWTTVSATSDLLNTHAISVTDQYGLIMENLMVISPEARNIRAGSEVDALISLISKDYP